MSRAYRIRVRESINQDLKASDEVCADLEILEILPGDQMADLVTKELKARGYEPIETPLDEFLKAGGSAKCLTLRLDGEEAAGWKTSAEC